VAAERTADEIQKDIERARASLATAVDQLAERTSPKRAADRVRHSLQEKAQTPAGKLVLAAGGALLALLVIRKIAKH
jgi:hypothetical protein